jgi:hypothetical protein
VAADTSDVVVAIAAGDYRVSSTLVFDARDSGLHGHTVEWQGPLRGTARVLGSTQVTGWQLSDRVHGIYSAPVPRGSHSRQLYVDGKIATIAQQTLDRSAMNPTVDGYQPTGSDAWLLSMPGIQDAEIAGAGSWTSRVSPIDGVSGGLLAMEQPAWKLNTWGYDTIDAPYFNGPLVVENALALLDQPGEWYLDSSAGRLYYKPLAGKKLSSSDVEIPRVQALVSVSGTLANPAHDISFSHLTFSGTTWNAPTTTGYADQQTGSYLDSLDGVDQSNFESTRIKVKGMPAGVQVSAAHDIAFSDSHFTDLGANGIGIGNDSNATASGVGLATQNVKVANSEFDQIGGTGISVGGFLPDAHHPSDPRMVVSDIDATANFIHDVGQFYSDSVGILMTYVSGAQIAHNEISKLPYSGIATGYGWGMADAGGSPEYLRRGTYNYYPLYSTSTTLKNVDVADNYIHDVLTLHTDGAPYYNLSASPGSVVEGNYIQNANFGFYFDEGTRSILVKQNVVEVGGQWWHANYSNSPLNGDMTTTGNYTNSSSENSDQPGRGDSYSDNTVVPDRNWPLAARQIIYDAGIPSGQRRGEISDPAALYAGIAPEFSSSGTALTIAVPIGNAGHATARGIVARAIAPKGWTVEVTGAPRSLAAGKIGTAQLVITPASGAASTPITTGDVTVSLSYFLGWGRERASGTTTILSGGALRSPLKGFTTSTSGVVGQAGDELGIHVAGADIWGAGGQHDDQYGTIFNPQSLSEHGSVTTFLDTQEAASPYTKSGVVVRNDLTGAGGALGYASMYRLAGFGVAFAVDTNGDGYLDNEDRASISASGPIGLRLVRNGTQVSGWFSVDEGATWTQVGPTRTLVGANLLVDAGVVNTSHDASTATTATFHGLSVANDNSVLLSAAAQAVGSNGDPVSIPLVVNNLTGGAVTSPSITSTAPAGWTVSVSQLPGSIAARGSATATATVTGPAGSSLSTGMLQFHLVYTAAGAPGTSDSSVAVSAGGALPSGLTGFTTSPTGVFGASGDDIAIRVAGADIWGAGGQHDDAYGTVFQKQAISGDGSVTAQLDSQERASDYTKSGVVVRNDLTGARSSFGYAAMYRLAGFGVAFAVDTDGDGFIDSEQRLGNITSGPIQLRLARTGNTISGFVSQDAGVSWTQVGSAPLVGANQTLDAGVINTSHDASVATTAHFSKLVIQP